MSYNRVMRRAAFLAGLLALLPRPGAAQETMADEVRIERQEWRVLGWNDECGVAFTVLSYPPFGSGYAGDPASTRVGTFSIPVAKDDAQLAWTLAADGQFSFSQKDLDKAEKDLKKDGYSHPGFPELIQDARIGDQPLLAEAILSTSTLKTRIEKSWPGPEWRWAGANYNPLNTCGLFVFEKKSDPKHYTFLLARVYNPRVRTDRAYAHASNARLLFNTGDLDIGAVEAETAALLAPDLPIARYEHAAMLALTGQSDQAVKELAAAVKLDDKYSVKAYDDEDFADLRRREDFRKLTRPPRR